MKASFFKAPGGPSVLEYGDVSKPIPTHDEVLVQVKACALNRIDVWQRNGKYTVPPPHIPGSDIAGVLEDGREVVVNPALPCGECECCKKGSTCEFVKIVGFSTPGGYAQWMAVPIKNIYPKPKQLSFVEAAAFPLTFLTAWHMLKTRAELQKGESVFIWGASGGLGVAAIQVAKHLGAHVSASTRSPHKLEALKNLDADLAILLTPEVVLPKVDVVFDTVGEQTWNQSIAMLKPFGRLILAGTTSGKNASLDLQTLYTKQLSLLGARMGSAQEFEEVLSLIEKGILKPVVSKVFPLSQAAEAHRFLESGEAIGKIVLEV